MHSKKNEIRVLGQRSIPSTFIFQSSNYAKDSKQDGQKESCISLSDFLGKKLHKNPVQPKIIKGKSRPFCSPLGPREEGGSGIHQIEVEKEEGRRNCVLDQLVFEQFKPPSVEKAEPIGEKREFIGSCGERGTLSNLFGIGSSVNSDNGTSSTLFGIGSTYGGEQGTFSTPFGIGSTYGGEQGTFSTPFGIGSSQADERGTSVIKDMQGTRKRLNPTEGGDEKHSTGKHLLVLGGLPEPKRQGRKKRFTGNKKRMPLYNHYANGCGWWDCDMEGVDAEEVGSTEIWEGVGSTTFGGI